MQTQVLADVQANVSFDLGKVSLIGRAMFDRSVHTAHFPPGIGSCTALSNVVKFA